MTTVTTEPIPKPPAPSRCGPSDVVPMLVPPSEVTDEDLLLVSGVLSNVLEVPGQAPGSAYTRLVVEHGTFPGGHGDVYVRTDGLVAIQRYVTGPAAELLALRPEDVPDILAATADAAQARDERVAAYCLACAELGEDEGLCPTHEDDMTAAGRYRRLAERLGQ